VKTVADREIANARRLPSGELHSLPGVGRPAEVMLAGERVEQDLPGVVGRRHAAARAERAQRLARLRGPVRLHGGREHGLEHGLRQVFGAAPPGQQVPAFLGINYPSGSQSGATGDNQGLSLARRGRPARDPEAEHPATGKASS
jgi:hypothetical protein